jgi:DUF917 family protein
MKITDMVISAIIKRGVLYEARNVETEFRIPTTYLGINEETKENEIKIIFKTEYMSLRIEKDENKV